MSDLSSPINNTAHTVGSNPYLGVEFPRTFLSFEVNLSNRYLGVLKFIALQYKAPNIHPRAGRRGRGDLPKQRRQSQVARGVRRAWPAWYLDAPSPFPRSRADGVGGGGIVGSRTLVLASSSDPGDKNDICPPLSG